MPSVQLEQGTIHYEEAGPGDGRPVVCVAGYLSGGDLWAGLAERLARRGLRVLMPTWPMGAHTEAMKPGADVTPAGIARMIAGFLTALDLDDVVLIGNDTGGAICQVVATRHPERLGALVLTNCDAFEEFPPGIFKNLVRLARIPGALRAGVLPMRFARVRRSPLGFGMLSRGDLDHLTRGWVRPMLTDRAVFDDLRRFTAAIDPELTQEAARTLTGFDRPALLTWGADDKLFPLELARRLAAVIPGARLETIPGARTFVMIDEPDRLAELVGEFLGASPEDAPARAARAGVNDRPARTTAQ